MKKTNREDLLDVVANITPDKSILKQFALKRIKGFAPTHTWISKKGIFNLASEPNYTQIFSSSFGVKSNKMSLGNMLKKIL